MNNEEITKEIVVAMIQQGFLSGCDNNATQASIRDQRISSVCEAFSKIHRAVLNSSVEPL